MSKVKYISSQDEIPAGQKYVLVMYGEHSEHTNHPRGLTITVASNASELSFLAAVHTAKQVARQTLIPLSQARLYVVPERIRRVEFGHRAALKTRYPVAFRLPSFGGAPYA